MISYDLDEWKQDPRRAKASLVFQPGPRQALLEFTGTRNLLILTILETFRVERLIISTIRELGRRRRSRCRNIQMSACQPPTMNRTGSYSRSRAISDQPPSGILMPEAKGWRN